MEYIGNNANSVEFNSAFRASSTHLVFIGGVSATAALLVMSASLKSAVFRISPVIQLQLLLVVFCGLSSVYSQTLLVSMGQTVFFLIGIIISLVIGRHCSKSIASKGLKYFFQTWLLILAFIYTAKLGLIYFSEGVLRPVPSDERAMLAAICGVFFVSKSSRMRAILSFSLLFFGQSFSALVASIPLVLSSSSKFRRFFVASSACCLLLAVLFLVKSGSITLYSKTFEYFLSGSGRFALWSELVKILWEQPLLYWLIGNGYMSERQALVGAQLTWNIDAHSNILQSLYGLGILGTALMILIWVRLYSYFKDLPVGYVSEAESRLAALAVISCILMGMTSSHFFSRPSMSAIFISSLYHTIWCGYNIMTPTTVRKNEILSK